LPAVAIDGGVGLMDAAVSLALAQPELHPARGRHRGRVRRRLGQL